ncbi:MAG: hypothetical protein C0613_15420 [Desulfobulbaceae bacterium]|nr:MAG: hypothetical protein C0613_15420 [Desulfobulbaceae bacterium]
MAGPQLLPAMAAPGTTAPAPAIRPARPKRANVFLSSLISTVSHLGKGVGEMQRLLVRTLRAQ